ncbi:catalytics [Actinidia rufa]|uniref:ER membrane protein complex subunit 1 n=1 Tax=Actinidia rufa TaxID=165716 RepID=A0A7J0DXK0_9ERIC|nr:catalytics [Actinidia rufa]
MEKRAMENASKRQIKVRKMTRRRMQEMNEPWRNARRIRSRHQQYIGKVRYTVFHTEKAGRKCVVVSTEENVIASLDLCSGKIFWRHVLGADDAVDKIDIALGKYVITLSSEGSILRAWNLPDGQMVWETFLSGSRPSKAKLFVPGVFVQKNLKVDKDNAILVYGNGCLHAVSSIDGEVLWNKELTAEGIDVQELIHPLGSDVIYAVGFGSLYQFDSCQHNAKNVKDEGKESVDKIDHGAALSDALPISEGQQAFALIKHEERERSTLFPEREKAAIHTSFPDQGDNSGLPEAGGCDSRADGCDSGAGRCDSRADECDSGVEGCDASDGGVDSGDGGCDSSEIDSVWARTLLHRPLRECSSPIGLKIYQWQVPHHHAMDENPSVLVVGGCAHGLDSPGVLSVVDAYTGKEINSLGAVHSIVQVIPLPFTDSTERRLHLLIDANQRAHLFPRTREAISIVQHEFANIYWYSVEADNGIIRGHVLKDNCVLEVSDEYCFNTRDLWSIVFPSESEKIIATVTRKSNEVLCHRSMTLQFLACCTRFWASSIHWDDIGVFALFLRARLFARIRRDEEAVHTQAKVMTEQDVMYKYVSKNLLFVANVAPKGIGKIGSVTPGESWLVVYLIDTVTGRILHRMTHHGARGPVHAILSENWVVYHYFNLKAHRYEMSVIEICDQSRADNKDIWKLVLGKHNLTSPISSYSRPEVITNMQSYFFTHTVKTIAVTSTAKGITSKQLLIGTIGDQVLALDKRFLDPHRMVNPTQVEKEEGIIPLTDSLPIMPQSYVTHILEGLRGIVTVPAKLESTALVFPYEVDLFFTRIAPSRTYDSLTKDFSYALLLITVVALLVAIFVTWVWSERKELQEKWR